MKTCPPASIIVITGVGPFSLGEEIVRQILESRPKATVLGIDIVHNPRLKGLKQYYELIANLNPFEHSRGMLGFKNEVAFGIKRYLEDLRMDFIQTLVQSAGIYDSGPYLELDDTKRASIWGLNLVGHSELLHVVMDLNSKRGFRNASHLTHMEIGSFHGLNPRKGRSVYAASKAAAIDMSTALFDGKELGRCIYLAPASIDTHMLHRNHWVQKAGGSSEFFDKIFSEYPNTYEEIFRDCNRTVLLALAAKSGFEEKRLIEVHDRYVSARYAAHCTEPGVLPANTCARVAVMLLHGKARFKSGVYAVEHLGDGKTRVRYAAFKDLTRQEALRRSGIVMDVGLNQG